jgi:peptidoglycan-associated lipoprotein
MKWKFAAGLLTAFVVEMHAPPPVDACGIKLTVKSSAPRKAVARTSNPSDVLLLGAPPRRLELDLAAAGHHVEVAPNAAAAKKKSYAVVITDPALQGEARSSFGGSPVVVRSGDVIADTRSVEKQVGRKPLRTDESRAVVAARPTRTPIAAGPAQDPNRRIVAAREPKEAETAPPPPRPEPEKVSTAPTRPEKPAPTRPEPEKVSTTVPASKPEVTPEPKPRPAARVADGQGEVYFGTGSSALSGQANATLARTVRWLKGSQDVHVIIEGHADPTGNPDSNLALGQKRAELIRDHLVSAGIDASRIEVISYGDTRIKYGKTDPRNRRAAIVAK